MFWSAWQTTRCVRIRFRPRAARAAQAGGAVRGQPDAAGAGGRTRAAAPPRAAPRAAQRLLRPRPHLPRCRARRLAQRLSHMRKVPPGPAAHAAARGAGGGGLWRPPQPCRGPRAWGAWRQGQLRMGWRWPCDHALCGVKAGWWPYWGLGYRHAHQGNAAYAAVNRLIGLHILAQA